MDLLTTLSALLSPTCFQHKAQIFQTANKRARLTDLVLCMLLFGDLEQSDHMASMCRVEMTPGRMRFGPQEHAGL